ncbi:hypothetical protein AC579_7171 [Pseudocercospora musae]|uniref:Hydrophobin n=1 Tax=Pseudocercospora musae TaxID=113226 RepID=A0A139I886_9PEZI|nr:hypothetical protein AC579_7171 [Pseudocercospora musae]
MIATLVLALVASATAYCSDGGQLHCCAATFNGGLAPVKELSNLACYDLTPATVNCIIAEDNGPCTGTYSCCQVNDLVPVAGLFCSPPPGGCLGEESDGGCTDLLNNQNGSRFGQCTADDITDMRNGLGLGPLVGA